MKEITCSEITADRVYKVGNGDRTWGSFILHVSNVIIIYANRTKVYLRNGVTEQGIYLRGSARSKRRRDAC